MSTADNLQDLDNRPKRYWHVDGLPELVFGVVLIVWGAGLLVGEALPRSAANLYWGIFPAILILSGLAGNWVTRKLKERLTYPRTGYIEYREPGRGAQMLAGLLVAVSAAAIAALVVYAGSGGLEAIAAPAFGVIMSLCFVVASVREKAPHFLVLAGVALVLGAVFAALGLGWMTATNWMFFWLGAAAITVGAWRLRRYLRRHSADAQS